MTTHLFQTTQYKTLITDHIFKTIEYMFNQNQDFSLACEIEHIKFNPELPQQIKENFEKTVLFVLSGYTYQSAKIEDKYLSFEAGFGNENFGSTVIIPLLAIKQIFIEEHLLIINLFQYPKKTSKNRKNNSMKNLLNNPENRKLLKRKK